MLNVLIGNQMIDKNNLINFFDLLSKKAKFHYEDFNEIDGKLGDGDLGITILKGLEEIVKKSSGGIFNNAAQHWNHSFFWNCLTPNECKPEGDLLTAINNTFGTLEKFKEEFPK